MQVLFPNYISTDTKIFLADLFLIQAISQNILLAVAISSNDIIQIKNTQPRYKEFKCSVNCFKIEPPAAGCRPEWHNYFLSGVKGILEYLQEDKNISRKGFVAAIDGNIPPASGLSSSSALVCAAALATAFIYEMPLKKQILAMLSAKSEQFIGTVGGGMDQAIAFFAKKGCAQFIEFNPVRATPIKIPNDFIFVIANSLSEAHKAATSDFNQRVVECKIAAKFVAKMTGRRWQDVEKLVHLQSDEHNGDELEGLQTLIDNVLTKETYTKDDLEATFNLSSHEFDKILLTPNTINIKEFKLRSRALHVIQGLYLSIDLRILCD